LQTDCSQAVPAGHTNGGGEVASQEEQVAAFNMQSPVAGQYFSSGSQHLQVDGLKT
jgi:hypothetical protein